MQIPLNWTWSCLPEEKIQGRKWQILVQRGKVESAEHNRQAEVADRQIEVEIQKIQGESFIRSVIVFSIYFNQGYLMIWKGWISVNC